MTHYHTSTELTMAILKLGLGKQNAIAGTVQSVALTDGKFGQQYRVTFDTGDDLYLPKDGFERQTARMNKLPNELDGTLVTFWKKPMDGDPTGTKGFLNIDLGNTAGSNAVAQRAITEDNVTRDLRNHGVLAPKKDYDQIKAEYVACLGDAIAILNDATETFGTPFTPAEVTSVAATLYISRSRVGV